MYSGRVKEGEPLVLSGSAGRMRFPPRGLGGGADGSYGAIEVNGEGIAPSSSPTVTFQERDVVRLRLPGGGGHGDPARRRRERIEADLKAGYVTPEGARRDCGYDWSSQGGVLSEADPHGWNLVVMKPGVCNREEVQLPVLFYRDAARTNAPVGDRTSVARSCGKRRRPIKTTDKTVSARSRDA